MNTKMLFPLLILVLLTAFQERQTNTILNFAREQSTIIVTDCGKLTWTTKERLRKGR